MTVDAIPGRSFEGKIQAIDARVSAESRNVTARAVFANPDRKLLPGMFANLTVTTGEPAAVLTVPRTAIIYSLYGDDVFVVTAGAACARAGRHGRQRRLGRPHRRAALRSRRPGARREDRDRGRPEGGRARGDRRPDQAPGQFAGHARPDARASEPGGNAPAVTDSP